jgi:hypothetical protein
MAKENIAVRYRYLLKRRVFRRVFRRRNRQLMLAQANAVKNAILAI